MEILLAQRAIEDSSSVSPAPVASPALEPASELPAQKSLTKAFIMNLAVPGAGHIYAGKNRGWGYLGLEAVAWVGYLHYHELGRQKETEFENYADAHWSYDTWKNSPQYDPAADQLILGFWANNKQQYYEDIGKISTYSSGWDSQDNRTLYRSIRQRSNNFLKDANIAVAGAFVNRIVSAVDILHVMKNRGTAQLDANTKIRFKVRTKPFSSDNAFGFVLTRRIY